MMPTETFIEITYLIATALFVLSLKWLSSPTTARHGVWAGEIGMALAIGGTLLYRGIVDYKLVAIGLVLFGITILTNLVAQLLLKTMGGARPTRAVQ